LVTTNNANPSLWTGNEKQGYIVKFDGTTDTNNQVLHVAVAQGTEFIEAETVYQYIASGASTAYGRFGSLETPTAGVNGVPITDLNYPSSPSNVFTVQAVDYDNFIVQRNTTDIRALFTRYSPTESTAVVIGAKRRADLIHHSVEQIVPKGTSISWGYNTDNGVYNAIEINETDRLAATEYLSGNVYLKATLTTTNTRVSPVVDVNTLQSILITNRLNEKTPSIGTELKDGNNIIDRWRIFDPPVLGSSAGSEISFVSDPSQTAPYTRGYFQAESGLTTAEKTVMGKTLNKMNKGDYVYITAGNTTGGGTATVLYTQVLQVYDHNWRDTNDDLNAAGLQVYVRSINDAPITIPFSSWTEDPLANGDGYGIDIYTGFIEEYWPDSSSTMSSYVGKKVNLKYGANSLKVVMDTQIPQNTDVEVWVKTSTTGSNKEFGKLEYVRCPLVSSGLWGSHLALTPVTNDGKFHESEYFVSGLPAFTTAQMKLVFKGTESIDSPRIKNMKVFALIT